MRTAASQARQSPVHLVAPWIGSRTCRPGLPRKRQDREPVRRVAEVGSRRSDKRLLVPCLPLRFSRDDKSMFAGSPYETHFAHKLVMPWHPCRLASVLQLFSMWRYQGTNCPITSGNDGGGGLHLHARSPSRTQRSGDPGSIRFHRLDCYAHGGLPSQAVAGPSCGTVDWLPDQVRDDTVETVYVLAQRARSSPG